MFEATVIKQLGFPDDAAHNEINYNNYYFSPTEKIPKNILNMNEIKFPSISINIEILQVFFVLQGAFRIFRPSSVIAAFANWKIQVEKCWTIFLMCN